MKRILAILLAVFTMFSAVSLVSCHSLKENEDPKKVSESTDPVEEYDKWGRKMVVTPLDISQRYDADLKVLCRNDTLSMEQFDPEFATNTKISEAIFKRNAQIEADLGVTIFTEGVKGGNWNAELNAKIEALVNGGLHDYDLIANFAYYGSSLAMRGMYYDWNKVENIYPDQCYWNHSFMEQGVVNNKMYMVVNDACLRTFKHTFVTFFNKSLAASWLVDVNLYDAVNSDEWTIGFFMETVKNVFMDKDEMPGASVGDTYGLITSVSSQNIDAYFYGLGLHWSKINDDNGLPELNVNTGLAESCFEEVRTLMFQNEGVFVTGKDTNNAYVAARQGFNEGRSLFSVAPISDSELYFSSESLTFGLLPLPKADESDPYTTSSQDAYDFLCIPSNTQQERLPMLGAVTEYMAYLSYMNLKPAFFETIIKLQYADRPEDAEMFDLILENIYFDFAVLYSASITGNRTTAIGHFWPNIFQVMYDSKNYSMSFVSEYGKYSGIYELELQAVIDWLLE